MNSLLLIRLLLSIALTASGTDEAEEAPKNALCKTLKDGTVDRQEIDPNETELRKVMAQMGYVACE